MPIAEHIDPGAPGRVLVSAGPLRPLLLDTHEATVFGFYDRFGDLHTLIYRMLSDDMWGISTKQDVDWRATLTRLGIKSADILVIPEGIRMGVVS
jgi:hypothetical protein